MTWIVALLARLGVPDKHMQTAKTVLIIAIVIVLLVAAAFLAKTIYDSSVIARYETEQVAESVEARETAAEERAADAIQTIIQQRDRVEAIESAAATEATKPPEARATLPPTTLALNCKRMEQAYSARELAGMAAYQEHCR